MLSKRHAEILNLLETEGTVSISAMAQHLSVSLETVRRDLRSLSENGTVVRIHGAVGLAGQMGEAPFQRRMRENAAAKQAIAKAVAETISDGESIMLDTGTTTSFIARELMGHRRLTVVTNSSDVARTLATVNGNRVYMAGGELRSDSGAAFGQSALKFVGRFTVNHSIISAGAVDVSGVMDFDLGEAELARTMLTCGDRKVVATDHTKYGRRGLVTVAAFSDIDELITDRQPPSAIAEILAASGTKLTVAVGKSESRKKTG
ncbi:MAG: DeoR/GlpR family DNA-binding transcription regulator [Paracoccaceae bacterium]